MTAPQRKIRVVIQQPSLATYRVPVYQELVKRPEIDLAVHYAPCATLETRLPDGFRGVCVPMHCRQLGAGEVYWHAAQWKNAARAACDVLILSWDMHYVSLVPTLLRARWAGLPTVLWGHGYSKHESSWRAAVRASAAKLGTALLLYNHRVAKHYINLGWDPSRIFVALNALDQRPIQEARQSWFERKGDLQAFCREHRLDQGPVILFVSRLKPANRLDLLIQAVAKLKYEFPTLQVVIIGKGQEEENRIRDLAQSLDVARHLRFEGAIYDEYHLAPWFLWADVFCYPANIGLSILHAFGYGLPVITSDDIATQNPEIEALRHGENGLLYAANDPDALATTLRRLFSDQTLAKRLGEEARRTILERFTLNNMVDGMEAAIRFCGIS